MSKDNLDALDRMLILTRDFAISKDLLREILLGASVASLDDGDSILYLRFDKSGEAGIGITAEEARLARELIEEGKKR